MSCQNYVHWICDKCGKKNNDLTCLCGRELIDFRKRLLRIKNGIKKD